MKSAHSIPALLDKIDLYKRVIASFTAGMDLRAIALETGLTPLVVYRVLIQNNVKGVQPLDGPSGPPVDEVVARYRAFETLREIAEHFDCSLNLIRTLLISANEPIRKRGRRSQPKAPISPLPAFVH